MHGFFLFRGYRSHQENIMRITRLYTGSDSHSHFEDIEVPFESREDFGLFTLPEPAKAVFFREIPPGWKYSWHNVVCREYVIVIDGEAEIEVGSGEKRKFGRGDILLAEDLTGHGHRTRVLGKKVWRQVFITLP
jgi:mannose-6-phosphate isomerase-like protein (cupin superfamily)